MDLHLLAHIYKWPVFIISVIVFFFIDFYGHRLKDGHEHEIHMKEAIWWSIFWVGVGILFGGYVYYAEGVDAASRYFSSYILEKGMSVDNIAVWLAILTGMSIAKDKWHELLTWGVVGAIIFRGLFIFGGMSLIHRFSWLEIVLGFFLLWGAFKIAGPKISLKPFKISFSEEKEEFDPDTSKIVQVVKKGLHFLRVPISTGSAIFLVTLLTIELTDVIFALDSVPVVIALNDSPFVAASSNLFAILGLRALFFVVSDFLNRLRYLKYGLGGTLLFIASKMIFGYRLEPIVSLVVIAIILTIATVFSLLHKDKPVA